MHCNDRRVYTRIVVPPVHREEIMLALHAPAHQGYEATLRKITQRFWWQRIRSAVSVFVRRCEVCDRDRCANSLFQAPLGQLPGDAPFALVYIDLVGGQSLLSLGASPKSVLTMP